MADYLLHQSLDGTPVGVFSLDGSRQFLYLPGDTQHAGYGKAVVNDRPSGVSESEWAQRLAQKTPGVARWTVYSCDPRSLTDVLLSAKFNTSYD